MQSRNTQPKSVAPQGRFRDLVPRISARPPVIMRQLRPDSSLPLLIESSSKAPRLNSWARANQGAIESQLLKYGGILFRGFHPSIAEFEEFMETIFGRLLAYSHRSTPRKPVNGKIYTSTEYPAHQSIPLHNENAYARNWPMKIGFLSLQCAASDGETPICDSRRVYKRIPADVRERFAHRGLMYVHNYGSGSDPSWQDLFQTISKSDVENYCRHHVSRLPADVREALLSIFNEDELPRNVFYGDGTPIEASDLDRICEVYELEKIIFRWHEGDVLLLDNMLAAHGRNPFTGERKVVVGMAEPYGLTIQ